MKKVDYYVQLTFMSTIMLSIIGISLNLYSSQILKNSCILLVVWQCLSALNQWIWQFKNATEREKLKTHLLLLLLGVCAIGICGWAHSITPIAIAMISLHYLHFTHKLVHYKREKALW